MTLRKARPLCRCGHAAGMHARYIFRGACRAFGCKCLVFKSAKAPAACGSCSRTTCAPWHAYIRVTAGGTA